MNSKPNELQCGNCVHGVLIRVNTFCIIPCDCLSWKCISRDGSQGMAHGAVFMVNVQVLLASNGSSGDTSENHLPIRLKIELCFFNEIYDLYSQISPIRSPMD